MTNSKKLLIISGLILLVAPLTVDAFWPFSKAKNKDQNDTQLKAQTVVVQTQAAVSGELSASGRTLADSKYKLWENSFEKKDVDTIITNKNNFWFTLSEITYLFNQENSKAKNPFLNNLELSTTGSSLKAAADFKKFIRGRASFTAKVKNEDNKIKLEIEKLRLYGIPVPASWASNPLNEAINNYFNFLYQDERYQGFDFSISGDIIKLDLKFSQ